MAAPTQLVPEHIARDLRAILAGLRTSRLLDPGHEDVFNNDWHHKCEVCRCTRRLNYLIDQIPRKDTT